MINKEDIETGNYSMFEVEHLLEAYESLLPAQPTDAQLWHDYFCAFISAGRHVEAAKEYADEALRGYIERWEK